MNKIEELEAENERLKELLASEGWSDASTQARLAVAASLVREQVRTAAENLQLREQVREQGAQLTMDAGSREMLLEAKLTNLCAAAERVCHTAETNEWGHASPAAVVDLRAALEAIR